MIRHISLLPTVPGRAMLKSNLRTYSRVDRWRAYQPFFPEHIRLEEGHEPSEEYWPWQGGQIHLDRFSAKNAPLTVILLHGGGGCGRLLAPFGRMFHNHGFNAVLPDLPGYGLSEAPAELSAYDRWVDCAVDLAQAESARTGKPVAFFGMSVGGYLALMAGMRFRQTRAVIATTLADPRLPLVRDQFALYPRLNRMLTPFLGLATALFGSLRVPIRWFCNMATIANDPELSNLLLNDPIAGSNWVTLRFLHTLLNIKPPVEPEPFKACPVLFAQPAADRWTTLEASSPVFDRLGCEKELVMLENCGHLPVEQPGIAELERKAIELLKRVV
jgi:alpha-beta hydrolase superfamily lysophospholipase